VAEKECCVLKDNLVRQPFSDLIDRCDLFFFAKVKDGDYHQEMNEPTFLNRFENQLMPALKSICSQWHDSD
jgi:hypothetical protein